MKRSRFSEEQIIGILTQHRAGLSANGLRRRHGASAPTFYKWRSKYGGVDVSDAKRPKVLEDENARLTKPLAEPMMDVSTLREMLGKKLLKPDSRRPAVSWAIAEKRYSQRRACNLVGIDPRVYRYRSTRGDDGQLRARLRELAVERRRFGYRGCTSCSGARAGG